MSDHLLPRSRQALKLEVELLIGATIAVALLSFILIRLLYRLSPTNRWHIGLTTFITILVIGALAIFIRQKKWHDVSYKLTPDSIMVNHGAGFISTTHEVYLYESIISASMSQGYFGKKYGYGDIVLVIPKLEADVRLKFLDNPEKQLKLLQSHLKNKVDRQTLVT